MKDQLKISDSTSAQKSKSNRFKRLLLAVLGIPAAMFSGLAHDIQPKGQHYVEHWRGGVLLQKFLVNNAVSNEGKNKLWDVMFGGVTQITAWYIGIIDNSSYSASPTTDTMASHGGWIEFTTYSQSTRVAWGPAAASTQAITNTTAATFDITGSATLKGIFVTSISTKSGTSGTLWSTALFGSTIPVTSGDQIKITYTVSA